MTDTSAYSIVISAGSTTKQKEKMKKVLFTTKVDEAKTFHSFGAATAAGEENLGTGMFRVDGRGGIRLIVQSPAINETTYVKDIVA